MRQKTRREPPHENCEHVFWIEDLSKEGYFCACSQKHGIQAFKMRGFQAEHFD